MDERNAHLIAFIEAITTGQTHQFEHVVKTAYIAEVSQEDLLTAFEIARFLADVPEPVLTEAHTTVRAWGWMVARGLEHQRSLAPQAVEPPAAGRLLAAAYRAARLCLAPHPTVPAPEAAG